MVSGCFLGWGLRRGRVFFAGSVRPIFLSSGADHPAASAFLYVLVVAFVAAEIFSDMCVSSSARWRLVSSRTSSRCW